MRKIKLIWDFRGAAAAQTAAHHEKHLKEYIAAENLNAETGGSVLTDVHAIAFLVVEESMMIKMRDTLKPHRAEVHL